MKRSLRILLAALAAYLILLALLLAAEAPAADSSIRSFGDAVWFSLVTMTTVGYGDLAPVTAAGRVLGLVFAICSLGVLTAVIGLGFRLLSGETLPRLRLRRSAKLPWYVFRDGNEASLALAEDLRARKDGGLFIFPAGQAASFTGRDVIRLDASPEELLRLRGGNAEGLLLFRLGDDPWKNYADSLSDASLGLRQYCLAEPAEAAPSQELSFFSPREALARLYWRDHPLRRDERCLVLIGCGRAGSALLERALLTNVFESGRHLEYHVFEDSAGFAALHPRLCEALREGGGDRLVLHEEAWNADPELLARADRILLCRDEDSDDLALYQELKAWFPAAGTVHLRLTEPLPGLPVFGSLSETVTEETVLHEELDRRAKAVNDLYNEDSPAPVAWSALSPFLRQSNIAADHLPVKVRLLLGDEAPLDPAPEFCRLAYERYRELLPRKRDAFQEIEHRRWLRFYLLYNWAYDPARDDERRLHPMLLPYEQLSEADRRKDTYAWELLEKI